MLNIDRDVGRFRDILKGRIRRDLKKYVSTGELIGRQGNKTVSVPIHSIGIPRLRYGDNSQGVGQGEGEGEGQSGQKPGEGAGSHDLEVEFTVEELAQLLGEELNLPRIEPRGDASAQAQKARYNGIAHSGPESLRHFRRTFKRALQRSIAEGSFDPRRPRVVPIREDRRYRTFEVQTQPRSAAVILYLMDVSGSMGKDQKEIVRSEAFWIDAWIRRHYDDVESRFIVHDAAAREVDRDVFFTTRESGGTLISSAYKLAIDILEAEYPVERWNVYPFHFSDGDNWSATDTRLCVDLVRDRLLPRVNQFGYAQVDSPYGSGQFIKDLTEAFGKDDRVALSRVKDRDAILGSIRELLGKGR